MTGYTRSLFIVLKPSANASGQKLSTSSSTLPASLSTLPASSVNSVYKTIALLTCKVTHFVVLYSVSRSPIFWLELDVKLNFSLA